MHRSEDGDADLPEAVFLHDEAAARRIFTYLEAVDWKWTIVDVLEQPLGLLEDVLTLKALQQRVERALKDDKNV